MDRHNPDAFDIDPEFQALLPPQTSEARQRLEALIDKQGCRAGSLVVGVFPDNSRVLVDGHHTREICKRKNVPMPLSVLVPFENRQQAIQWIIDNQLGRRNLTDEQRAYFIGKKYLEAVKTTGRPTREENGTPIGPLGRTAAKIAESQGVAPSTVKEDAAFAKALDQQPEEVKAKVLEGTAGVTKKQVISTPPDKLFCPRCTRVGPTKNCEACKEARAAAKKPAREPGDESEHDDKKKADAKAKRNNGKPAYDDREIEALIGRLVRALDDRAKVRGKSDEQKAAVDALRDFVKAWKRWK